MFGELCGLGLVFILLIPLIAVVLIYGLFKYSLWSWKKLFREIRKKERNERESLTISEDETVDAEFEIIKPGTKEKKK